MLGLQSRGEDRATRIMLAALLGALTAPSLSPAAPARAAPACTSAQVRPGQVSTDKPWAQQRYGLDRLAGIADGRGQVVAVLDSGVDARHPQLKSAVAKGFDGLDASGDGRLDCDGHGTAVASIIAARPVSGVPFRGVAPAATILPIRVSEQRMVDGQSNGGKSVSTSELAQWIDRAVSSHARVINISMVVSKDDATLRRAVAAAIKHDVVVVAAVGNAHDQGDPTPYPAAYPGVIGVGAIGPDGSRSQESQVGPYVDLVAPGAQITAAVPGGGHATTYQGTSFATPFVAGAAALVRQYYPELSASAVAARLAATADPAPGDPGGEEYGAGVVDPYRAVVERTGGTPTSLAPLPASGRDAGAAAARAARVRGVAGVVAAVLGGLVLLIVLVATVVPAGRRRDWRPGLRR